MVIALFSTNGTDADDETLFPIFDQGPIFGKCSSRSCGLPVSPIHRNELDMARIIHLVL